MANPKVDLIFLKKTLSPEDFEVAKGIVSTRGKNKDRLRLSKPGKPKNLRALPYEDRLLYGKTAYVWRMVAFHASSNYRHHCMPVTAEFNLPEELWQSNNEARANRRALVTYLDDLADKILNTIAPHEHRGTLRWARALGY